MCKPLAPRWWWTRVPGLKRTGGSLAELVTFPSRPREYVQAQRVTDYDFLPGLDNSYF